MIILVTGGNGFIGKNFINYYKKKYKKNKVINLDKNTYAGALYRRDNFEDVFYKTNIGNTKKVGKILKKYYPKYIYNFAAETHVDNSIVCPEKFFQNNVIETLKFIDIVKRTYKKKKFKFIHISTDEVFGDLKKKSKSFTESSCYRPRNPYSASKASSDFILKSYYHTYRFPCVISNCANNYGPYQNFEKFIPKIIINAIKKKKIPVYGRGAQIREWLHVNEHCKAIDFISKKGKIGESYNIGSGLELSNIKLVNKILDIISKKKPTYNYKKLITFVEDRKGHDFRYSLNFRKLSDLGFKSNKQNFNLLIEKTVNWYLSKFDV